MYTSIDINVFTGYLNPLHVKNVHHAGRKSEVAGATCVGAFFGGLCHLVHGILSCLHCNHMGRDSMADVGTHTHPGAEVTVSSTPGLIPPRSHSGSGLNSFILPNADLARQLENSPYACLFALETVCTHSNANEFEYILPLT